MQSSLSRGLRQDSRRKLRRRESGREGIGHYVVLLQHILSDFNQAGFGAHSCISNATTSSSLPCTISEHGVPHSGQQNNCTELRGRCAWQLGQKITTGTSSTTRREPCSGVFSQAIS